jgi:hypothetical protein
MSKEPPKFCRFWYELKRRNVFRVVALYAPAAFILLEEKDINLIAIGFPVTVVLAWCIDITPEWIRRTGE